MGGLVFAGVMPCQRLAVRAVTDLQTIAFIPLTDPLCRARKMIARARCYAPLVVWLKLAVMLLVLVKSLFKRLAAVILSAGAAVADCVIAIIGAAMIAKAKAGEDGLLRGAPHAVIAVVPKDHMWPEDASIALTYLELAAHAMGVGACWGGFLTAAVRNFKGLREYLGIGEDEHVCGAQMIGYPLIKPVRQFPPRKKQNIEWIRQRKEDLLT